MIIFCTAVLVIIAGMGLFFYKDTDGSQSRDRIYAFHIQPKNTIDVAFIGASGVNRGWSSVEAWHNYGYTSWAWSTSAQPFYASKYIIKDIQRTQTPALYVISYSPLRTEDRKYSEGFIHDVVGSLPFSVNRLQAINKLMKYREDTDISPLYFTFPFLRFHNDWEIVFDEGKRLPVDANTMGTLVHEVHFGIEEVNTDYHETDLVASLNDAELEQLTGFLSWLKEEDLPVLFFITPRSPSEKQDARFKAVEAVFAEYGFPYLNLARDMDSIGLEGEADFQNGTHLNYWGRTKFTNFVSEYLLANYDLPDHRVDPAYSAWDDAYENYLSMVEYMLSQCDQFPAYDTDIEED